nr:hypothetical protein [Pandoravirus aubagnensis]
MVFFAPTARKVLSFFSSCVKFFGRTARKPAVPAHFFLSARAHRHLFFPKICADLRANRPARDRVRVWPGRFRVNTKSDLNNSNFFLKKRHTVVGRDGRVPLLVMGVVSFFPAQGQTEERSRGAPSFTGKKKNQTGKDTNADQKERHGKAGGGRH